MQAYGCDPYIVYNRKARPNIIKGKNHHSEMRFPYRGWHNYRNVLEYNTHPIGFCGKYYLLINVFDGLENLLLQTYDIKDIDKLVEDRCNKKDREFYLGIRPKWEKKRYNLFTRVDILDRIEKFNQEVIHSDSSFIRNNTPVIINHASKSNKEETEFWITTFDGCLADVSFYKVMEPWQAYQELSMYMAGPLCTKYKPIPEIDDKTMAEAKGFDKWSFRSGPKSRK